MAAAYKFIVCLSEIESPLFAKPNVSRLLHRLVVLMKGYVICFSNGKNWNIGQMTNTVQYRPSEMKIVFGLKVPSIDGLGLILW